MLTKAAPITVSQNNILLRKLAQLKQVRLRNGRTFYTRYERVNRGAPYPTKVRIRRTYIRKIGPTRQRQHRQRQQQQGSGYVNSQNLMKGISLGKKAADSEVGCMVKDNAISLLPRAYRSIKNRLFKRKKTNNSATI